MLLTGWSVNAMQGPYQREGRARAAANGWMHDASTRRSQLMRDETGVRDVEPELGAIDAYDTRPDEPLFPLVIRGYDRRMVEEHVELLTGRLAELEALQSPSVAVQEALERVANDTGSILKEAHESADGVLSRARGEADRMVRDARDEADRMIASAEARVRQLAIDTDTLWQERMRLIDDSRAVAVSLSAIADEAAERFPPEDLPEEPAEVDQPTEAFDVAEMLAAEEAGDERPLPDGLEELEPPPEFGP
jgi:cell division septum initiation protein DivIVA